MNSTIVISSTFSLAITLMLVIFNGWRNAKLAHTHHTIASYVTLLILLFMMFTSLVTGLKEIIR